MSTLQVQITAGPQAGARFQLNQSPVSFGRSAENTLAIDLPVVSRQHGELNLNAHGQWVLTNLSQNGTRVGKKNVTKKPYVLSDGASIVIGDTEVFRVYLINEGEPAEAGAQAGEPLPEQPTGSAPGAGLKGRSKLWIGLGIWFAFCIGLMVFFATLDNGKDADVPTRSGLYIPGSEIPDMQGPDAGKTAIKRLLAEDMAPNDPNESRYSGHLEQARKYADEGPRALYDAYNHYQQAISYSENREDPLPTFDRLKYDNVLTQLAEVIYDNYMQAYRLHKQGSNAQARQLLDELRNNYYKVSTPDDTLANHIKRLRNTANR